MHVFIVGVGGTFMGSLAQLAVAKGMQVSGCDKNIYAPMREQLENCGIEWQRGYELDSIKDDIDLYIIGNVVSRGNTLVEHILERQLPYTSGPEFLARYIAVNKWVLCCSGTHGKTTTSSMLAWILDFCGYNPCFLIGGVAANFGISARLTDSDFFVIEGDEYDTAFFDKRSKFVHYRPKTLVINNLEFDHADIFNSLADIQYQFHLLLRTMSSGSKVLYHPNPNIAQIFEQGAWSILTPIAEPEQIQSDDYSQFTLAQQDIVVQLQQGGAHNMQNALSAIYAAHHVGVPLKRAVEALMQFKGVKRRMELVHSYTPNEKTIYFYDDFAHHPTSIELSIEGIKKCYPKDSVVTLVDLASNSMQSGIFADKLQQCSHSAHHCFWLQGAQLKFKLSSYLSGHKHYISEDTPSLLSHLKKIIDNTTTEMRVIIMSNGNFDNIRELITDL